MKAKKIKNGMLVLVDGEGLAMVVLRPVPKNYYEHVFVFPLCPALREAAIRYHPFYLATIEQLRPYVAEEEK